MGELLVELKKRGTDRLVALRFVLQCVLAIFAEDRRLLPNNLFISCVQNCISGQSSYDVLGGLFREMNTSYWFRLAHENLGEDGRAGLVERNYSLVVSQNRR